MLLQKAQSITMKLLLTVSPSNKTRTLDMKVGLKTTGRRRLSSSKGATNSWYFRKIARSANLSMKHKRMTVSRYINHCLAQIHLASAFHSTSLRHSGPLSTTNFNPIKKSNKIWASFARGKLRILRKKMNRRISIRCRVQSYCKSSRS